MNDTICHYGVKGMRWGIRRYQNKDGSLTAAGKRRLRKKWSRSYNQTVDRANKEGYPKINKRYENIDIWGNDEKPYSTKMGQKYIKEIDKEWRTSYVESLKRNQPELFEMGENWVSEAPFMNMFMKYIYD